MTPAQVLAVFGEPRVYEDWMGGNLNDALLFHGLRLHFSKCDSRGPLPTGVLNWIVIHQRQDAFLFGRPVAEWNKDTIEQELLSRGYLPTTTSSGDMGVSGQFEMSFDDDGRLVWVELYH
jgi:hypothetical protein